MIHDFDAQLQVSLRALEDVVAPALAGAEKHVVEQLALAITTIGFVKSRLPESRRFHRMELRSWLDLAETTGQIASATDSLSDAVNDGTRALNDPETDDVALAKASRSLREQITMLSAASVGQPHQSKLDAAILERNGTLIDQCRLWCVPFGFEIQPEKLPEPAW